MFCQHIMIYPSKMKMNNGDGFIKTTIKRLFCIHVYKFIRTEYNWNQRNYRDIYKCDNCGHILKSNPYGKKTPKN